MPRDPHRWHVLSEVDAHRVHSAALEILERTGMRIDCDAYYAPLEAGGARVDRASSVVRFPTGLIEQTIERIRIEISSDIKQNILNGVVASKCPPPVKAKFGGACVEFLDGERGQVREPTHQDLVDTLRLGEALPDVHSVGNPVVCLWDERGTRVEPRMQRVVTAATVAKHTSKCASTEVWNAKELDFLIEIGTIVRGSSESYIDNPCFITAKETISPLQFPEDDGRILLLLAERGLPCTIIPMPLSGMSAPVTKAANIAVGLAEILGVMTALKCAQPSARLGAAVISGVLDMRSATASFSAPGAILQDLATAQIVEELYGQDFGVGSGYIDASVPGPRAFFERYAKMSAAASSGRCNHPVGILNGGKRFCPEAALIDLEIARYIDATLAGIEVDEETLAVDLITAAGIGGSFMAHEHTVQHFRAACFLSDLLVTRVGAPGDDDILQAAAEKKRKLLSDAPPVLDEARAKAIDDVVNSARELL